MRQMPVRVGSFSDRTIRSIPQLHALSQELLAGFGILFSPSGAEQPLRGPKGSGLKPGELVAIAAGKGSVFHLFRT